MDLKDKKLEDLVVTLPLADGTEMNCAVTASFEVMKKNYFALQPLTSDNKPDPTQGIMLYRVEEDAEENPVVMYIEDDMEFLIVANTYKKMFP